MTLRLVTKATTPAVDIDEVKAHLRVDSTDEDALIEAMTATATETAEQITGRALMLQTWELTLDEFPDVIDLTRVPVSAITSITYKDTAGATQTLGSGLYRLRASDDYGFAAIAPAYNTEWPDTLDDIDAVTVRYVAGYANAAAVPQPIKSWILLQVGATFENRESEASGSTSKLAFADGFLDRYRVRA